MTKVVLLGDSIRQLGYGTKVQQMLPNGYYIWQPDDNGRYSKYTLRCVCYDWKDRIENSDIIHWNNGLWDLTNFGDGYFTKPEEYAENMLRIAGLLKQYAKTVIFATTTPVSEANIHVTNESVRQYNDLIVPKLSEMGIIINDLYSLVNSDIDKYICDDTVHLSQAGIDACAKQVADAIIAASKD